MELNFHFISIELSNVIIENEDFVVIADQYYRIFYLLKILRGKSEDAIHEGWRLLTAGEIVLQRNGLPVPSLSCLGRRYRNESER